MKEYEVSEKANLSEYSYLISFNKGFSLVTPYFKRLIASLICNVRLFISVSSLSSFIFKKSLTLFKNFFIILISK